MPSDFSRSVSHESEVFQRVLVAQTTKNTCTVSSDCGVTPSTPQHTNTSTPSVASAGSKACVSVSTSLPVEGGTREGSLIVVSSASTGDLSISKEPEGRLFDKQVLRDSVFASSEAPSQGLTVREDKADEVSSSSVSKALPPSHHRGLLFLSKSRQPSSEITGYLNEERKVLWIGNDLVISKSKASHGDKYSETNTEVSKKSAFPVTFTDSSLIVQKIGYKCKVLQEHSKECVCGTPRLHVYLTDGHKCGGECSSLTEPQDNAIYAIDKSSHTLRAIRMTGKMKARGRDRKSNSFTFSDNMIKVEASNDDACVSSKPPQTKRKLSVADRNKEEPESELLGEGECVWLPTIMSTLSGDVEYVVLDDDALNLGTSEEPSPESLKSKINTIYCDIDEKPVIQTDIASPPNTTLRKIRLPPLRRLSEVNCASPITQPSKIKLPPLRRLSEVNCASLGGRNDGQAGEITPAPKVVEVSIVDDPASSSLAEVCTNHCPSIKDIFGDINVKEEPVEDVKQDMTVDDFSKEMIKSSSKESGTHSPGDYVQQGDTGDGSEEEEGSGKGLFAKLIKEERDTNEKINADAHNSDDSLGPLQIDEKYLPSPEDSTPSLAKNVVKLNMPSVNIISPFKIKILLGSPNQDMHQVQVDPPPQVGPSSTAIFGKVLEVSNMITTVEKVKQPIKIVVKERKSSESILGGGQAPVKTGVVAPDTVQSLTCIYCHTSCPNTEALIAHFENHQKEGLIICYFCQKSFGDKTGMKRHMRTHTGEKPYQCKICGKRFSLPGNFKKHRDIHEDKRTEPCEVCGKTFRRKEHLKYHMRTHTGEKPYSCTECGTCFTARYSLQIHMNIHLGKKPYKCTYCSKAFSDKSTMRKHVRVHTGEKPFRCQECWRCFGESGTLAAHMATHRNDRPYSCDKCDLRFKTTGGLRQHDKVHTGEKQFACKFCGMKFLQKYNMTMHERIHTGEKPYTCSQCQRSFRSRSCLAKHIVLHGGDDERRFGCDHCESRFYRKAHLRRHIDMHLGIKHYECDYCQKKFCTRGTLRSHCKTFHSNGARRFPCKGCGRVFKRKVYVNTHLCANTAYKPGNKMEDETKEDPSEGVFPESSDSEDFTLEVKSEPEDMVEEDNTMIEEDNTMVEEDNTMVEEDRVDYDANNSEMDYANISKEVKLEWEPHTSE